LYNAVSLSSSLVGSLSPLNPSLFCLQVPVYKRREYINSFPPGKKRNKAEGEMLRNMSPEEREAYYALLNPEERALAEANYMNALTPDERYQYMEVKRAKEKAATLEAEMKRIALRKLGLCMQKIMAGTLRGKLFNWKVKKQL